MLHLVGSGLFAVVGVAAALMAVAGLRSRRLLAFHQRALGVSWEQMTPSEQEVGLALTRSLGLGFFCAATAAFAATGFAIADDRRAALLLSCIALAFCLGLALVNRELQSTTAVRTPWRGSLYAALVVAVGMVLCAVG